MLFFLLSVSVIMVTVMVIGAGLLWAPFAAFICGRLGRKRGLDVRLYATTGALYSVLCLFPSMFFYMGSAVR